MAKNKTNGFLLAVWALPLTAIFLLPKKKPAPVKPITGGAVDFILQMYPYAVAASRKYPNVPPIIILAFASLESGFGKRAPQYNFFGMKVPKNWAGKKQLFDTTEILPRASGYNFPRVYSIEPYKKDPTKYKWRVADYFKAFDNPQQAFEEFARFLNTPRYRGALQSKDLRAIVQGIKNAGYATAPAYVNTMMQFISKIQQVLSTYKK